MGLTCRSWCLQVASLFLILTGSMTSRIDFPKLQPLLETIRVLEQKGLTGEGILQTFLSRGVQPRGSAASLVRGGRGGIAGAQLPRLPLFLLAGCCKCWPLGPRDSGLRGCDGSGGMPCLLLGMAILPVGADIRPDG
jgi:hypothetical protein